MVSIGYVELFVHKKCWREAMLQATQARALNSFFHPISVEVVVNMVKCAGALMKALNCSPKQMKDQNCT